MTLKPNWTLSLTLRSICIAWPKLFLTPELLWHKINETCSNHINHEYQIAYKLWVSDWTNFIFNMAAVVSSIRAKWVPPEMFDSGEPKIEYWPHLIIQFILTVFDMQQSSSSHKYITSRMFHSNNLVRFYDGKSKA